MFVFITTTNIILILLCILLFEVTKLWLIFGYMAAITMNYYYFLFILFIRVKTTANFHKWTWKLGENIRCFGGGEIITDIKKTLLTSTPSFTGLALFIFFFVFVVFFYWRRIADVFSRA